MSCGKCQQWINNLPNPQSQIPITWDKDSRSLQCYPDNNGSYNNYGDCSQVGSVPTANPPPSPFQCGAYPSSGGPSGSCKDCSDCVSDAGNGESYIPNRRENFEACCGPQPYLDLKKTWDVQKPFTL